MNKSVEEKMYTMEETATELGMSFSWVARKVREGKIKAKKTQPIKGREKSLIGEEEVNRVKKELYPKIRLNSPKP